MRRKLSLNSEPALWIGLLGAVFSLALAFGLSLDLSRNRVDRPAVDLGSAGGVIVVPGAGRRPGGPAGCGSPVSW